MKDKLKTYLNNSFNPKTKRYSNITNKIKQEIFDCTSHLPKYVKRDLRILCLRFPDEYPKKCKKCGKLIYNAAYPKFCSKQCSDTGKDFTTTHAHKNTSKKTLLNKIYVKFPQFKNTLHKMTEKDLKILYNLKELPKCRICKKEHARINKETCSKSCSQKISNKTKGKEISIKLKEAYTLYGPPRNFKLDYIEELIKEDRVNFPTSNGLSSHFRKEYKEIIAFIKLKVPKSHKNFKLSIETLFYLIKNDTFKVECKLCGKIYNNKNKEPLFLCGSSCISKNCQPQVRKTTLEKYGYEHFSQSKEYLEKAKETNMKKYGYEWHMQRGEEKSGGFSWYDYKLPSGKNIRIQGYEHKLLDELLLEYNENDILTSRKDMPEFWYIGIDNKRHRYFPDMYIPKTNTIYEVKSQYYLELEADKNKLKFQSVIDAGFNFKLKVY